MGRIDCAFRNGEGDVDLAYVFGLEKRRPRLSTAKQANNWCIRDRQESSNEDSDEGVTPETGGE